MLRLRVGKAGASANRFQELVAKIAGAIPATCVVHVAEAQLAIDLQRPRA